MSNDLRFRDDEAAILIALFRYGIIAPVAELESPLRGDVSLLVEQIASRLHHQPGRGALRVAPRTIYEWLGRYRRGGIEALRPRWRKDRGSRRVLTDKVLERAIDLRKEIPGRKTRTLLDIMLREGLFRLQPRPHRSTLDRHLVQRGASRRQLKVLSSSRTIQMKFDSFGDLWVGDYHHGPPVLGPDGKPVTSKIGGFIDHATRYPVADRYYLDEKLDTLRDSMLRALLRWGLPRKVYVDRARIYRSDQLRYSLKRLDANLIHSRSYYSKGRGVIEKWWQVVKEFEQEVCHREEILDIHELNRLWEAFRELRYCDEPHSELGRSPNEAIAEVTPRPLDPGVARELFLVGGSRKVHKENASVSVEGIKFLCDSFLRGQKVQVRYDPNELTSVLVFKDGQRIQRAFPLVPNAPPEPRPDTEQVASSVDYLALLREDFDRKLLEHARPLAYAKLELEPSFGQDEFVKVVASLAGLKPRASERRELVAFWETLGPLPEELVRIGTEHAVRLSGRQRHPQVYLSAIRTLVLGHWKSPGKEPP